MKTIFAVLLALMTLIATAAQAVIPDSGWYFSPNLENSGFNIEIQDSTLFVSGFIYDGSGNPIWLVAGGPMATATTFTADVYQTANGPPLGGANHPATIIRYGTVTIVFPTTTTATINLNGSIISVQRFQFGLDFTSTTQPLLGEFAFVTGSSTLPVFFGERITLSQAMLLNGSMWAVGNRSGDSSRLAVGQYSPPLGQWVILLDSSPSYYDFFVFIFEGLNLIEGDSYVYLKGSDPTGSLPTIAYRIKSAQAAAGLNAPGGGKVLPITNDTAEAQKASAQSTVVLDESIVGVLRRLESTLQMVQ